MNKEEYIARYGEAAYAKMLSRIADWEKEHLEERKKYRKKYYEEHPERAVAANQEHCRKGGKYYEKMLEGQRTGLRGERHGVRMKHGDKWRAYKNIIAPESQIHHEWIPETADYKGMALVEADRHMHGIIDVIEILEGKITLLREEEIRREGGEK